MCFQPTNSEPNDNDLISLHGLDRRLCLARQLCKATTQKRLSMLDLPRRTRFGSWFIGQMDVSKNRGGPPKSSILIGFFIIFTIHFGVPLFLETPRSADENPWNPLTETVKYIKLGVISLLQTVSDLFWMCVMIFRQKTWCTRGLQTRKAFKNSKTLMYTTEYWLTKNTW